MVLVEVYINGFRSQTSPLRQTFFLCPKFTGLHLWRVLCAQGDRPFAFYNLKKEVQTVNIIFKPRAPCRKGNKFTVRRMAANKKSREKLASLIKDPKSRANPLQELGSGLRLFPLSLPRVG